MDDATKQAILSAIRSLMTVIGASLASHGVISGDAANEVTGAIMVILPIAWGIADKYIAERKTKAREVVAVNAGIAVAGTGQVGDTIRPADAPAIIREFSPVPEVQPSKEVKQ